MLMLLFSVPEIKQERFHNNIYSAIVSVLYTNTTLPIVCICLCFHCIVFKTNKNETFK